MADKLTRRDDIVVPPGVAEVTCRWVVPRWALLLHAITGKGLRVRVSDYGSHTYVVVEAYEGTIGIRAAKGGA